MRRRRVSRFGTQSCSRTRTQIRRAQPSIFSIGSIWFDLIEAWVPDPVLDRFDGLVIGRVSRQLASIIIAFPSFIWATRSILRDQMENPDKAESAVRRWVSNLGLLLTALVSSNGATTSA